VECDHMGVRGADLIKIPSLPQSAPDFEKRAERAQNLHLLEEGAPSRVRAGNPPPGISAALQSGRRRPSACWRAPFRRSNQRPPERESWASRERRGFPRRIKGRAIRCKRCTNPRPLGPGAMGAEEWRRDARVAPGLSWPGRLPSPRTISGHDNPRRFSVGLSRALHYRIVPDRFRGARCGANFARRNCRFCTDARVVCGRLPPPATGSPCIPGSRGAVGDPKVGGGGTAERAPQVISMESRAASRQGLITQVHQFPAPHMMNPPERC
jgi:hypothetical protein